VYDLIINIKAYIGLTTDSAIPLHPSGEPRRGLRVKHNSRRKMMEVKIHITTALFFIGRYRIARGHGVGCPESFLGDRCKTELSRCRLQFDHVLSAAARTDWPLSGFRLVYRWPEWIRRLPNISLVRWTAGSNSICRLQSGDAKYSESHQICHRGCMTSID